VGLSVLFFVVCRCVWRRGGFDGAFFVGDAVGTTTVERRDVVGGGTVEAVETDEDSL
jgi:hypothetical protein